MEDFVIDIQINVHDTDIEDTQIKTLTASVLEDQTLIMVMEDVAKHLNEEKKDEDILSESDFSQLEEQKYHVEEKS